MIWYACYGSNMDSKRFLKYILGGELIINGQPKVYNPCKTDINVPKAEEPHILNRRFYFAEKSGTWQDHGVGFISTKSNPKSTTYSKLYLISKAQFNHLYGSENGRPPDNINFEHLKENSNLDNNYRLYSRIISLNQDYKGYPILTFTNKKVLNNNIPMIEYVKLIANGLRMTHNLNDDTISKYLLKANAGITKTNLNKLLKELE